MARDGHLSRLIVVEVAATTQSIVKHRYYELKVQADHLFLLAYKSKKDWSTQ